MDGYKEEETEIRVGISVSSTPIAVNNATADVGIFLMIGALRQAHLPLASIKAGIMIFCDQKQKTRANMLV